MNKIALYWREKSTLKIQKREKQYRPSSKQVVKCVVAKAQDGKYVESLQKQTMGVTFNPQNSQLFTFSLPTEEIFSGTVANLSDVDFRAQTREMS